MLFLNLFAKILLFRSVIVIGNFHAVIIADITNKLKFSGHKAFWDYMGGVAMECLSS